MVDLVTTAGEVQTFLQEQMLNWTHIEQTLKPLLDLKETPEDFDQLMRLKSSRVS